MTAKRKIGRPSKYSATLTELICQRIAEGESVRAICRDDDMPSKSAVMNWLNNNEEFRSQYVLARDLQADHFVEEIIDIADDSTNDFMERQRQDGSTETVFDNEHVQRSKLRVDARKWVAARMAPKKYGDRTALDVAVTHATEDMTDDELIAIARGSSNRTLETAERPAKPDKLH